MRALFLFSMALLATAVSAETKEYRSTHNSGNFSATGSSPAEVCQKVADYDFSRATLESQGLSVTSAAIGTNGCKWTFQYRYPDQPWRTVDRSSNITEHVVPSSCPAAGTSSDSWYGLHESKAARDGYEFGGSVTWCSNDCRVTGNFNAGEMKGGAFWMFARGGTNTGQSCDDDYSPDETPDPPERQCPSGQVAFGNACVTPTDGQCGEKEEPYELPGGQSICIPGSGTDPEEPEPTQCEPGYSESQFVPGLCVPDEEPRCENGQVEWGAGYCFNAPDKNGNCPDGTTLTQVGSKKACIPGEEPNKDKGCPAGFKKSEGSDVCLKGQEEGGDCPSGSESVTIGSTKYCMSKSGTSVCPDGYVKQGAMCIGQPKPDGEEGTGTCPDGYTKQDSLCVGKGDNGSNDGDGDGDGKDDGDGDGDGKFAGTCGSGFQCDGDVLQCAIVREQHARNCEMFVDATPESDLYNAEKGKEGNQTGPASEGLGGDLAGLVTSDALLGSGSCLPDFELDFAGMQVTVPMAHLCPLLEGLGSLLLAFGFLLAIRIVGVQ